MRYFAMFEGMGGFSLGIRRARPEAVCVGYSEINVDAIAVYSHHFPSHQNYGDATKLVPGAIPDFDLLTGGFPCQAFSQAGKRLGFDDARGTMFFEIVRVLEANQPPYILLENVENLLSHDGGNTFRVIFGILSNLGYRVQWMVLNSVLAGVPQHRERIFIFGNLRGRSEPKVLPIPTQDRLLEQALAQSKDHFQALTASDFKGPSKQRRNLVGVCAVINAGPKQEGRVAKLPGEPSYTLRASQPGLVGIPAPESGYLVRRLTPLESERLQGFPDNWSQYGTYKGKTKPLSDSARYRLCGNAVTVDVIEDIIKHIF